MHACHFGCRVAQCPGETIPAGFPDGSGTDAVAVGADADVLNSAVFIKVDMGEVQVLDVAVVNLACDDGDHGELEDAVVYLLDVRQCEEVAISAEVTQVVAGSRVDVLLDEQSVIMLRRQFQCCLEFFSVIGFRNADGGSCVGRFYINRIRKDFFHLFQNLFKALQFFFFDRNKIRFITIIRAA